MEPHPFGVAFGRAPTMSVNRHVVSPPELILTKIICRHNYFQGMWNISELRDDAEYAIFDDMIGGFEFFKQYKQWFGCQQEFTTTDKYAKKRKVIWGKPCIWLSNDDPRMSPHIDVDWWDKNVITVYIDHQLATPTRTSGPQSETDPLAG